MENTTKADPLPEPEEPTGYACKNCGATYPGGTPAATVEIGKVRVLLGPCCFLRGNSAIVFEGTTNWRRGMRVLPSHEGNRAIPGVVESVNHDLGVGIRWDDHDARGWETGDLDWFSFGGADALLQEVAHDPAT